MDIISRHFPPPLLALVLTAGLVFLVDLMMPLGWVVWLPYIGLVFCASWLPRRALTLILSGICSVFIILGLLFDYLYIDHAGTSLEVGIFNRLMGIAVLWGTAALVMRQQEIAGAREDLVRRMQEVESAREDLVGRMQEALANIKTLRGLLPFCLSCKKIREGNGYWSRIETFVTKHSLAEFTPELCPECEQYLQTQLPREPSIPSGPRELLSSPHRD
jgi:hypothetical protein